MIINILHILFVENECHWIFLNVSWLMILGLTASYFSKTTSMVGLDYWVGFRRPIYANETIKVEWLVIRVTPNRKLGGNVVELRGRILG